MREEALENRAGDKALQVEESISKGPGVEKWTPALGHSSQEGGRSWIMRPCRSGAGRFLEVTHLDPLGDGAGLWPIGLLGKH